MMLSDELRDDVEAALAGSRGRSPIVAVSRVGGGCVSPVARVETEAGDVAFLKWSSPDGSPSGLFAAEAAGLEALRAIGELCVPAVLGLRDPIPRAGLPAEHERPTASSRSSDAAAKPESGGERWLLLEWLPPGRPRAASWVRLGRGLATLHLARQARYGWSTDNFIGSLPQANLPMSDWPTFWRDQRLVPQLERAYAAGYFSASERRRFDALISSLDDRLAAAAADGPSPLHGDLWSGNVHFLEGGDPALIDPATYHGHREVDLAMADLFGGFPAEFHRAYHDVWPVAGDYRSVRRPIYQLYYLLVHVNLFGSGYVSDTLAALQRTGSAPRAERGG